MLFSEGGGLFCPVSSLSAELSCSRFGFNKHLTGWYQLSQSVFSAITHLPINIYHQRNPGQLLPQRVMFVHWDFQKKGTLFWNFSSFHESCHKTDLMFVQNTRDCNQKQLCMCWLPQWIENYRPQVSLFTSCLYCILQRECSQYSGGIILNLLLVLNLCCSRSHEFDSILNSSNTEACIRIKGVWIE